MNTLKMSGRHFFLAILNKALFPRALAGGLLRLQHEVRSSTAQVVLIPNAGPHVEMWNR